MTKVNKEIIFKGVFLKKEKKAIIDFLSNYNGEQKNISQFERNRNFSIIEDGSMFKVIKI